MNATLTARQQEILDFIMQTRGERGYSPTIREIGERFDIKSPNGVMCHLNSLVKKGALVRDRMKARSMMPTNDLTDIEEAVLAERLACFEIAETAMEGADGDEFRMAERIAVSIRARDNSS